LIALAEDQGQQIARLHLYSLALVTILTLLVVRTVIAPVADAETIRTQTPDSASSESNHLNLIWGVRMTCSLPPTSAEPLDPPTTSAFVGMRQFHAYEHFKKNIASSAEVRIQWIGATFLHRFATKTENVADSTAIRFYTLFRSSRDSQIIDELGDSHETQLADLWCLLKAQASGEVGILFLNAPNVFYVRDSAGVLSAVDATWGGAGWEIGASPVNGDRQWSSGTRVLSH
jgi:hypothetical protein